MKTNIAVFFGCRSVEHEVSIISAVQAMHSIDREKYDVTPIYVSKDGTLYNLTDALKGGELVFAEDIFTGATPIVDQSSIFNTQYSYKKMLKSSTCKDVGHN